MNYKKITRVLNEHQYNLVKSSNPAFLFFCKYNIETFSTVVLIDNIRYPQIDDANVFTSIRESLENTFLLRGYKEVNILFVVLNQNPFAYRKFASEELLLWIADTNSKRLISYSNNDHAFDEIRNDLELSLNNTSTVDRMKNGFLSHKFFSYPIFTIALVIINVLIFIYMDLFLSLTDNYLVYQNFGCSFDLVLNNNEFYRLFTSTFLHADFNHLSSNMVTLLAIGFTLEPFIGHFKFILTYLISGILASLTSVLYHSYLGNAVFCVGASGAIYGIFGAYITYLILNANDTRSNSYKRIILLAVLMLLSGVRNQQIDHAAHIGGMIFGSVIAFICCICRKNKI